MECLSRSGSGLVEPSATFHLLSLSAFGRLPIRAGTWRGTRIAYATHVPTHFGINRPAPSEER